MSSRNRRFNKITVDISSNSCPKCGKLMQTRRHKQKPKKTFFYTQWDFCPDCNHVQHYEKYKSNDWIERQEQESFFNNLR